MCGIQANILHRNGTYSGSFNALWELYVIGTEVNSDSVNVVILFFILVVSFRSRETKEQTRTKATTLSKFLSKILPLKRAVW